MPENVDDRLSGLARAVGASVRPPSGAAVRRRAARQTARRRVTVSVLAVSLVGGVGAAAAVLAPSGGTPSPSTTVGSPTASAPAAPTPPPSSASPTESSPSASSTPNSTLGGSTSTPGGTADSIPFARLEGVWMPADGEERALVVLSDGEIGIGQAGGKGYPMCAGRVGSESDGSFPITVACSDWGTSGLRLTVRGSDLVLEVPASGSSPATEVDWVEQNESITVQGGAGSGVPSWLVGNWALSGDPAYQTFTIAADGQAEWTLETQSGQVRDGTATITSAGGDYVVRTTIGGDSEFWVFSHLVDGELQVVGGYGLQVFTLTSPSSP